VIHDIVCERGQHVSVCSAVWGFVLIYTSHCITPNCIYGTQHHTVKTGSNDIITIVLLIYFEYEYPDTADGLWLFEFLKGHEVWIGIFEVFGSFLYQE
jgi:hypothetical protein